jgi:FkbM family methyltransferase
MIRRPLFRLFTALFRRFYATPVADLIWKIPRSQELYRLLMGRLKPSTVEVLGHRIRLDPNDSLLLSVNGVYEETEARLFEQSIRAGDVVLDVGGHIGYYTLLAARAVGPAGHVFAFEPERGNYALLAANVADNGYADRVTAVNKAVMAQNGELRIYVSPDNAGDHHVYAVGDDDRPSYAIEGVALDEFFAARPDRTVNVVKMDVQGAEPSALRGMRGLLDANDDVLLFTELAPPSLRDAGSSAREYIAALADAGFDLHVIDEDAGTVTHTSAEQLAGTGDFGREDFVNLVCSKGSAFAERVRGSETLRLVGAS